VITRKKITEPQLWNDAIHSLPGCSILQTWEWGQVKKKFSWEPWYLLWSDDQGQVVAAALMLIRSLPIPGFKTAYVPQGPMLNWSDKYLYQQVIDDLEQIAGSNGAFSLKLDPEVIIAIGEHTDGNSAYFKTAHSVKKFLSTKGFIYSSQQIQFKNTAWLDLQRSEDELLSDMKQKTRYNVRLAGRKGVTVRHGAIRDIDLLYEMYLETSLRDRFIIRPREYYQQVWKTFMQAGKALPLIAEVEGEAVAGLMLFYFGDRSWYLYGMSRNVHRRKMPNYLLQWEAVRISKEMGCRTYDLWGAPEVFDKSDSLWGVYRFKKGFGAKAVQRIGAYDLPIHKIPYKIFIELVPAVQRVLRRLRTKQQSTELDAED